MHVVPDEICPGSLPCMAALLAVCYSCHMYFTPYLCDGVYEVLATPWLSLLLLLVVSCFELLPPAILQQTTKSMGTSATRRADTLVP